MQTLQKAIDEVLTPHQRRVLVALAVNGVPIDVLAERLTPTAARSTRPCTTPGGSCAGIWTSAGSRSTTGWRRSDDGTTRSEADAGPAPRARGPEVGCDECFEQLDRYVELELAGRDADAAIPGLRAHLAGCPACREEHESLRALVGGEQAL